MNEHERKVIDLMIKYAKTAIQFSSGLGFDKFIKDAKTVDACVLNLIQVGEMVARLEDEFIDLHKHIPWRKIKDMRNRIVHDYEEINLDIVWEVINEFLPELIANLKAL